jgi:hypothetical protein
MVDRSRQSHAAKSHAGGEKTDALLPSLEALRRDKSAVVTHLHQPVAVFEKTRPGRGVILNPMLEIKGRSGFA